jgi:N-acetylglucosamine malate deacetylase 1
MSDSMAARPRAPVLVIAAHPDDEVLGCGGTMARLAGEGIPVHILLMADGETSRSSGGKHSVKRGAVAARKAAAEAACIVLGGTSVDVMELPDNRMDSLELLEVVQRIESVIDRHRPACVFTHHCGDVNIDHRIVHDAVIAACRPVPGHPVKELLFFEVPSSTEWRPRNCAQSFNPNWFFDISATLGKKLEALKAYSVELRDFPHPRSLQAVEALARWRGATVGVRAAEAFILGRASF